MAYVITTYEGSIVQKADIACNTQEQLLCRISYTECAIEYHKDNSNKEQESFFTKSLAFLNSKIKKS